MTKRTTLTVSKAVPKEVARLLEKHIDVQETNESSDHSAFNCVHRDFEGDGVPEVYNRIDDAALAAGVDPDAVPVEPGAECPQVALEDDPLCAHIIEQKMKKL